MTEDGWHDSILERQEWYGRFQSRLHRDVQDGCRMLNLIVRTAFYFYPPGTVYEVASDPETRRRLEGRYTSWTSEEITEEAKRSFIRGFISSVHNAWNNKLYLVHSHRTREPVADIKCGVTIVPMSEYGPAHHYSPRGTETSPRTSPSSVQRQVETFPGRGPSANVTQSSVSAGAGGPHLRVLVYNRPRATGLFRSHCWQGGLTHNWGPSYILAQNRTNVDSAPWWTDRQIDMFLNLTDASENRRHEFQIRENNESRMVEIEQNVVAHEFGHYLNLGHQCVGLAANANGHRAQYCWDQSEALANCLMAGGMRMSRAYAQQWLEVITYPGQHGYHPNLGWQRVSGVRARDRAVARRNRARSGGQRQVRSRRGRSSS